MLKNIAVAVVFNFVIILSPSFSHAADVETWFKSQGNAVADGTAVADAAAPAAVPAVVTSPAEPVVEKASTSAVVAKTSSSISTAHTIDEIIFKISRAQANLENYGSTLNGHGPKAIEYLKQALQELQEAK